MSGKPENAGQGGKNLTAAEIHEMLAVRQQIAVIWSAEDVQRVRPDLDDGQAWDVLLQVQDGHDCNYGVTWDTLEMAAHDLYPERANNAGGLFSGDGQSESGAAPSNYYTDQDSGYNYYLDGNGRLMASPFSLDELLGGRFQFHERIPVEEFAHPPFSEQERQTVMAGLARQVKTNPSPSELAADDRPYQPERSQGHKRGR